MYWRDRIVGTRWATSTQCIPGDRLLASVPWISSLILRRFAAARNESSSSIRRPTQVNSIRTAPPE